MKPTNLPFRSRQGLPFAGVIVIAGVLFVLSLWAVVAARHPESMQGEGARTLVADAVLLVLCGTAATWAVCQRNINMAVAVRVGNLVGGVLGTVHIAHHVVEFFVPLSGRTALLAVGAGHVLAMLALFSIAGSATWDRTRSMPCVMVSGAWSAVVSVLILLAVACTLNFAFAKSAESHLHEAFLVSGMTDPQAFLLRNALEAASEGLLRMPFLGVVLSFAGGLVTAWMRRRKRSTAYILSGLLPFAFLSGTILLYYADSLERTTRPPFILIGLILAGLSLAAAPSVCSALRS